jgi:hypothetical protein
MPDHNYASVPPQPHFSPKLVAAVITCSRNELALEIVHVLVIRRDESDYDSGIYIGDMAVGNNYGNGKELFLRQCAVKCFG